MSCHILPEPRLLCRPRRPSAPVHMRPVPNNVVPGPASFQGKASRKVQVIRDSHLYNAEVLGPFQYRFLPRTRHRSYNPACSTCLQVDLSIVPTVPPQYFATNAQSATAKRTITLPWLEGLASLRVQVTVFSEGGQHTEPFARPWPAMLGCRASAAAGGHEKAWHKDHSELS